MKRLLLLIGITLVAPLQAAADERESTATDLTDLNAHQAVREGNHRLIEGHPTTALEAYQHAEALEPDAREIAFVEGLAHYDLKEFDKAREAFRKAAAFASDSLADDALYSLGTSDHTEALENMDNPELALSLLENAMGRYHEVLGRQPKHTLARDANFKAASVWRELKQQLQQQPPQQQESCDQEQDSSDQEKEDQQPQQSKDEEQQDKQQQSQPSEQAEQQEEQEQSESAQQPEEQQQQQQQAQAQDQEQVSREQAQRKLREMMQALRDRKKMRRELVQKMPVTPVDKDW